MTSSHGQPQVTIEVLHVPDCPNVIPMLDRLREITDHPATTREVATDAEAAARGMAGSPTLLINGVDPFALGTPGECSIACRLYRDENNQIVPAPSVDQLRAALTRATDPDESERLQLVPRSGLNVVGMETLLNTDGCTMPTAERPLRLAEFDALFASAVRSVERHGHDVRMRLAGEEGLLAQVRDLTARETSCCSFFAFTIDGTDQDLTLDVSVPSARQEILDALAQRARELSA